MKKLFVLFLVLAMVALTQFGCATSTATTTAATTTAATTTSAATTAAPETFTVGFSLPSFEFTLFAAMNELFKSNLKEMGMEGQVFNAEGNQEKQNKDIEDMVTMGFDAIIVCPITVEGAAPAMKFVNEKKIPLFTVDRQVTPEMGIEVVSHISVDQYAIGKAGGEAFLKGLQEKFPNEEKWVVLEIEGTPGASSAIDRSKGINDALSTSPKIQKLPNLVANYDTNTAVSVTEDVLTAHPEVMGIIAANDMMIEGSLQALVNFNKVGKVLLVGMDGQTSTVKKILEGSVYATPTTTPLMATYALEAAVKYLKGEKIDKLIVAPSQLVDAKNAQEYLDSPLAW